MQLKPLPFVLLGVFLSCAQFTFSQKLIAVQNGAAPSFHTALDSAIVHSNEGDTIFIPGGTFSNSIPISKRLHIIGVGHNPDSSLSTGNTTISGTLNLSLGSNYGSITGLGLNNGINVNASINNFTISRCAVTGITLSSYNCNNWTLIENVLSGNFWAFSSSNFLIINNIIQLIFSNSTSSPNIKSSILKNNIFLSQYGSCGYACYNYPIIANECSFENNIFLSTNAASFSRISNSLMYNNLFVETNVFTNCNGCSGNITGQPQSSIFVNQTGNSFSYSHDYHLQSTSPGKNAGKDGTDIGIYGGAFPWKAGSIPSNPHIQFQDISGGTDVNGDLKIKIKVEAQER